MMIKRIDEPGAVEVVLHDKRGRSTAPIEFILQLIYDQGIAGKGGSVHQHRKLLVTFAQTAASGVPGYCGKVDIDTRKVHLCKHGTEDDRGQLQSAGGLLDLLRHLVEHED